MRHSIQSFRSSLEDPFASTQLIAFVSFRQVVAAQSQPRPTKSSHRDIQCFFGALTSMARYESFEEDLRAGDPRDDFLGRGSGRSSPGLADTADDVEPDVAPLALPPGTWTLLDIVETCDNASLPSWPPHRQAASDEGDEEEHLTPLFVKDGDSLPIGFLRPKVLEALLDDNEAATSKMKMAEPCWKILKSSSNTRQQDRSDRSDHGQIRGVAFNDWLNDEGKEARCDHLDRLVRGWKHRGLFSEELGGLSNPFAQHPAHMLR